MYEIYGCDVWVDKWVCYNLNVCGFVDVVVPIVDQLPVTGSKQKTLNLEWNRSYIKQAQTHTHTDNTDVEMTTYNGLYPRTHCEMFNAPHNPLLDLLFDEVTKPDPMFELEFVFIDVPLLFI